MRLSACPRQLGTRSYLSDEPVVDVASRFGCLAALVRDRTPDLYGRPPRLIVRRLTCEPYGRSKHSAWVPLVGYAPAMFGRGADVAIWCTGSVRQHLRGSVVDGDRGAVRSNEAALNQSKRVHHSCHYDREAQQPDCDEPAGATRCRLLAYVGLHSSVPFVGSASCGCG